jgi:predicted lipid carrier protein YhbT
MMTGQKDSTELFFSGELKIDGDMGFFLNFNNFRFGNEIRKFKTRRKKIQVIIFYH